MVVSSKSAAGENLILSGVVKGFRISSTMIGVPWVPVVSTLIIFKTVESTSVSFESTSIMTSMSSGVDAVSSLICGGSSIGSTVMVTLARLL